MKRTAFLLVLGFSVKQELAQTATGITNLQAEHLTDPLGIDAAHPRLSWEWSGSQRDVGQAGYILVVGTDSNTVARGHGQVWEADRHLGQEQLVVYSGPALRPFVRYYWSVKGWDHLGKMSRGPVGSFETGMLEQKNWKGGWITDTKDIKVKPAAYFRHSFQIGKRIAAARVYISAAGLYELSINGKRVGDHVLDPMYTRFDRRNLYVTYDVTDFLKTGGNAMGVLLGNGWYNLQSTAVWYFDKAPWRARPSFCLDLRITYDDGSVETVCSGKSWKTALSPVIFNSIYTGEHVDDRQAIVDWEQPNFQDTGWKNVIYSGAPSQNVVAQNSVPIRITDTISPVSVRRFSDTDWVFDLGRNISGVSQITAQGPAGTMLKVRHGEMLFPSGHVDQSNINVHYRPTDDTDPFQTDVYILKGGGEESFQPRFDYKGFQYVEVTTSQAVTLGKKSLAGYFMHSDVSAIGKISSSNTLIDKIWQATNMSYLSNLFGYPTDCPQREKNGWTGDAQINVETGLYNFDAITVYEKWLADIRDEQQPNGVLPSIVPTSGWGYEWGNGPDWTSAIAIIPWNVYLFYGDSQLLADCYDNIKRYVDHINGLYPTGLTNWGLGDWIPVKSKTPVEFTSTAYYYADVVILSKAAKLFRKDDDCAAYEELASKIKDVFNQKYLDRKTGNYDKGYQTELSTALYWHLVPAELVPQTAAVLANRVRTDSVKLDVGLLGTKTILNALSENGYADLAYALASRKTEPSWGWWIENGAKTLYEGWAATGKLNYSLNHIMFGEISAWFYKGLGGIYPDSAHPGFQHIILRPNIVAGLDSFNASHHCPYGEISSGWSHVGGRLIYTAVIPPGTSADLLFAGPGQSPAQTETLSAGHYQFIYDRHERRFLRLKGTCGELD